MGEGERNTCIDKNVIFPKYYELDCLKNEKKKKEKKKRSYPWICVNFIKKLVYKCHIKQLKKVSQCGLLPEQHVQWQPF